MPDEPDEPAVSGAPEPPKDVPTADEGRCVSCGFLAVADFEGTTSAPVGRRGRESGTLPSLLLHCFVQAQPIREELRLALPGKTTEEAVLSVLGRPRNCSDWYRYQPGFSPKEHLEDARMMRIEEMRRAHDLQLAQMQADARASSERIQANSLEIAKAIKASSEAVADSNASIERITEAQSAFNTGWTYRTYALALAVLVLTAAAVIFAALGYFNGRTVVIETPTPTATASTR